MRVGHLPTRAAAVGVALVAAVALTACSSGSSSGGVPSASRSRRPPTTAAPGGSGALDQALVDYVHCMRAHGITIDDPAPRPGHSGLSLNVPDLSQPGVREADGQCKQHLAPVIAAKGGAAAARLTPNVMRALLAYSRCMRAHDIPLLDPDPTDGHVSMGDVAGLDSSVGRTDARFHQADASCRHFLPRSVPDDGTGPP
jgi:hypothetical protein